MFALATIVHQQLHRHSCVAVLGVHPRRPPARPSAQRVKRVAHFFSVQHGAQSYHWRCVKQWQRVVEFHFQRTIDEPSVAMRMLPLCKLAIDIPMQMSEYWVIRRGWRRETPTHVSVRCPMWRVQRSTQTLQTASKCVARVDPLQLHHTGTTDRPRSVSW